MDALPPLALRLPVSVVTFDSRSSPPLIVVQGVDFGDVWHLRDARGLTWSQVEVAEMDKATVLPDYLSPSASSDRHASRP